MRTVIGLYFELCFDEAGSSTGYNKLLFDQVSRCSDCEEQSPQTFGKHCAS